MRNGVEAVKPGRDCQIHAALSLRTRYQFEIVAIRVVVPSTDGLGSHSIRSRIAARLGMHFRFANTLN